MKTKLMLAVLLAAASVAQAGPPMTPAKVKKPLRISQIKGIFSRSQPSVPAQQGGTGGAASSGGAAAPSAPAPEVTNPPVKKTHVRTFLNHPVTAPGPK
ncbi:hypothetical protein [Prosthecobacter sp.]|uniref:hypothetical protein n=1 Tax=Prosthecobacter sp. TaxID=1965333 RepID=UPI003784A39C